MLGWIKYLIQIVFLITKAHLTYNLCQIRMQIRIENSQKKKLVEQSSTVKEIQMRFLDPQSSRQYSQVMQEIFKTQLRKQSAQSIIRKKSSAKILKKQYETPPKEKVIIIAQPNPKESNVEIQSQEKVIEEPMKKVPYKFSFKSFLIELIVAYSVTFVILYFIKLANFPYFQIILTIAFAASIDPWKSSNVLVLIAIPILIGNYALNMGFFTYPSILICYYAVMSFNQRYKSKQIFVFVLIFTIIFGMIVLPAIYRSLAIKKTFIYIFPILMFVIRNVLSYSYWVIQRTGIVFLQLPLFVTGLEYGVILTFQIQTIDFWYLIVFFSLQIINDRTQFFLRIVVNIIQSCTNKQQIAKDDKTKVHNHPVLPAHANGYACIHSFHLFLLVYIYAELNLYTAPFTSQSSFGIYVDSWYKPIIVCLLTSVYEIMSLVLEKKSKHKILFGFTSNKWWRSVLRGFMLSLGMWGFYLGLGVGVLINSSI